jgi:hypothetical protein
MYVHLIADDDLRHALTIKEGAIATRIIGNHPMTSATADDGVSSGDEGVINIDVAVGRASDAQCPVAAKDFCLFANRYSDTFLQILHDSIPFSLVISPRWRTFLRENHQAVVLAASDWIGF